MKTVADRHGYAASDMLPITTSPSDALFSRINVDFGSGYLVRRAPKLGHRTDGLCCVNNLPKVVT